MAILPDTEANAAAARAREIARAHAGRDGPLLEILRAVQGELGYLPEAAIREVAEVLNLTRAEVHGVASFYHDFRSEPGGRHRLRVCRAEACQAMGGAAIEEAAKGALGVDWHGTTPDGALTLEPVYCLGLCACAPAAMLDDRPAGRVDEARLEALIAEARA